MSEPIPISLVAHTVFCARRAWLEAMGENTPSVAIEHGVAAHQRVDGRGDDRRAARQSVDVSDPGLGIVGQCDVVRAGEDGLRVIEYKSSPIRRRPIVTDAQRVQLALQMLCLTSMGHTVASAAVYFTNHNKEVPVALDTDLLALAQDYVHLTRTIIDSPAAPDALHDDPRCRLCSHVGICLPEERRTTKVERVIRVPEPDGETLHLTTPGARASLLSGRVKVTRGDEELASVPVELVASLVVHGNVDVSSALVRELLWRAVPIVWCSGRGTVVGYAKTTRSPNGAPRAAQRNLPASAALDLARELISTKIANQATQLRRSSRLSVLPDVERLRCLARQTHTARSSDEVLGLEGEAASVYFALFPGMLAEHAGTGFLPGWTGRVGRGALDPLNACLNFTYGLLLAQCIKALVACGLDPHAGVLHSSGRNKPAMALDLMEEFRAALGDAVVVGAINNGELSARMVTSVFGAARLRDEARRVLVAAFERRLDHPITHPVFGYKATWRRTLEIQARMILGVIDGSQTRYVGVRIK